MVLVYHLFNILKGNKFNFEIMDPTVADANVYEYDADYDTRTNSNYGRSFIGIIREIF